FHCPRPPPPPLFPYTTLFRSRAIGLRDATVLRRAARADLVEERAVEEEFGVEVGALPRDPRLAQPLEEGQSVHVVEARRSGARGDRKSTRLNSSHDQISYAVF